MSMELMKTLRSVRNTQREIIKDIDRLPLGGSFASNEEYENNTVCRQTLEHISQELTKDERRP